MKKKYKIIVTGGAGYIGSHTIIELLGNDQFEVISLDNYSNSDPLVYDRIKLITGKSFRHVAIDLCERDQTVDFFRQETGIDGIIHFAAFKSVGESVEHPGKYYHNNISSLLNCIDAAVEQNIHSFIFSSSCSVYGNIHTLPVNESSPLNKAESPYAYTKQIGEEMIRNYASVHPGLNTIALRYFNPVGAHVSGLIGELPIHKPSNLVPVITQTAIGKIKEMTVFGSDYHTRDGSCVRDYIHVSDIAIAHVQALSFLLAKKNPTNFIIYNLGSGNGVTVFEAIHSFEKISGIKLNYKTGPRRPGDVEAIYSDSGKAEKELGWKPQFSLDEMMQTAWKWEQQLKEIKK